MEERKRRTRSTRNIIKSIIRNIIIRRGLPLQVLRTHNRVLMKAKFPLIANAIIDLEAETVIIGQGLMTKNTGEMTHVIERIDIILVKGEETQEKEVLKLSPNHLLLKI